MLQPSDMLSRRNRFPTALFFTVIVLAGYILHLHYVSASIPSQQPLIKTPAVAPAVPLQEVVRISPPAVVQPESVTVTVTTTATSTPSPPPPPPVAPKSANGLKFAILTMTTSETSYDYISHSNKQKYAKKHGYDLIIDYTVPDGTFAKDRGPVWHKLNMIGDAINSPAEYDWIWWVDYDTLFTNTSVKLENIVHDALADKTEAEAKNLLMLLTADCFPLNAGSMLFRAHADVKSFLSVIVDCGKADKSQTEQDCMRTSLEKNVGGYNDRALWIPQTKINSFPEEIRCWDKHDVGWQSGDFVIHFPGAWAHVKGEDPYGQMMRKYKEHIDE